MATTKTTGWYTISGLSGFNSKNGYVGGTSWYWGKYNEGARSGFIGVGNVDGSSRNAVLVFWLPFPSSLISSNITIDKIEVQMNQTVSDGISSDKNYATFACATGVLPDTPKAWNGSGRDNDPLIFAIDNTVTTRTAGTTWNPIYTYTVTNRSNLPAGRKGCYIQFSGGNYQVQSMSEFTMGASTYPKFRFTYTDSSIPSVSSKTVSFYPMCQLTSGIAPGEVTAYSNESTFTFPTVSSLGWTRSGYTLINWNTTQSSTGTNYSPGTAYNIAYSSLQDSYYARWQANTPSTVTFTFNPGSYSDGSKSSYTKTYSYSSSSNVSLPSGSNYFTGRTDSGSNQYFYLTCNCGAGSFSNGVSVATNASSDWTRLQTLYVQNGWSLNNGVTSGTCYTSYTPNSNTTFYPYWGDQESSWQYNVVLTIPNEKPTRSGYSFVEWNTNSSGTGTSYQPGGSIRQPASNGYFSNKTLYAIWEANQVYINYYTDNDTAQPTDTIVQGPYDVGDTVQLSNGSGWISSKWGSSVTFYTNYNFQGGSFSNGVTPNSTYSTSRIGKYDWVISGWFHGSQYYELQDWITLDSNIGIYPYWADSSSIVSHAAFTPITPIRKGYKFLNWNTETNGNGIAYYAGTNYNTSAIDKNLTLYAIWEPEWTIKINNGTNWGDYHVWIYTGASSNNGWQQAIPYVYDGSNWKLTKL